MLDVFNVNMDPVNEVLMEGFILDLYRYLKVNAEISGINDVVINGRKVVGSAAALNDKALLYHATYLVKKILIS